MQLLTGSSDTNSKMTECKTMIAELNNMFDESNFVSITPVVERIHTLLQSALKTVQGVESVLYLLMTTQ